MSSRKIVIALMIIYTALGASIAFQLASNPLIDFKNYGVMIRDLSNACITICSITIATILGVMAIISTRSTYNKTHSSLIDIIIFPVYGILFGFLSIYTSYFEEYFSTSKFLNGITIMLTITSILVIYIIFTFKKDTIIIKE